VARLAQASSGQQALQGYYHCHPQTCFHAAELEQASSGQLALQNHFYCHPQICRHCLVLFAVCIQPDLPHSAAAAAALVMQAGLQDCLLFDR
jgi:hypothetical protein